MTDHVVLGRDRELYPRGHQRHDAIFGQHRRIEARPRVHVEIAPHSARAYRRLA